MDTHTRMHIVYTVTHLNSSVHLLIKHLETVQKNLLPPSPSLPLSLSLLHPVVGTRAL